jgi:hypothetical protein
MPLKKPHYVEDQQDKIPPIYASHLGLGSIVPYLILFWLCRSAVVTLGWRPPGLKASR